MLRRTSAVLALEVGCRRLQLPDDAALELVRFLQIKRTHDQYVAPSKKSCPMSPGAALDKLWHFMLLDTDISSSVHELVGGVVRHVGTDEADLDDSTKKMQRLYAMNIMAREGHQPDVQLWEAPGTNMSFIYPITQPDGSTLYVCLNMSEAETTQLKAHLARLYPSSPSSSSGTATAAVAAAPAPTMQQCAGPGSGNSNPSDLLADGDSKSEYAANGDSELEYAADGDSELEYAADGDSELEYAADGDSELEYAADGDSESEYAADGDSEVEPAADGDSESEYAAAAAAAADDDDDEPQSEQMEPYIEPITVVDIKDDSLHYIEPSSLCSPPRVTVAWLKQHMATRLSVPAAQVLLMGLAYTGTSVGLVELSEGSKVLSGQVVRMALCSVKLPIAPATPFVLFLKMLTGETRKLTGKVAPWMLVSELKAVVQSTYGIPSDKQRLIYAGRQLEDQRTLESNNIRKECTIHLVERLRGC